MALGTHGGKHWHVHGAGRGGAGGARGGAKGHLGHVLDGLGGGGAERGNTAGMGVKVWGACLCLCVCVHVCVGVRLGIFFDISRRYCIFVFIRCFVFFIRFFSFTSKSCRFI